MHVRTVKPKKETPKAEKPKEEPKEKPKEEEKKGMVEDPYWKELGEAVKREKIAEDGAEHSDKLSEDSGAEHNVEEMVQDEAKVFHCPHFDVTVTSSVAQEESKKRGIDMHGYELIKDNSVGYLLQKVSDQMTIEDYSNE